MKTWAYKLEDTELVLRSSEGHGAGEAHALNRGIRVMNGIKSLQRYRLGLELTEPSEEFKSMLRASKKIRVDREKARAARKALKARLASEKEASKS